MARVSKRDFLLREIARQKEWIKEHGGDIFGYVKRYGMRGDPSGWYGDGGELIFQADYDHLKKLEAALDALPKRRTK